MKRCRSTPYPSSRDELQEKLKRTPASISESYEQGVALTEKVIEEAQRVAWDAAREDTYHIENDGDESGNWTIIEWDHDFDEWKKQL